MLDKPPGVAYNGGCWRGVRVAEGARLEIVFTLKRNMGSNPILSAKALKLLGFGAFSFVVSCIILLYHHSNHLQLPLRFFTLKLAKQGQVRTKLRTAFLPFQSRFLPDSQRFERSRLYVPLFPPGCFPTIRGTFHLMPAQCFQPFAPSLGIPASCQGFWLRYGVSRY